MPITRRGMLGLLFVACVACGGTSNEAASEENHPGHPHEGSGSTTLLCSRSAADAPPIPPEEQNWWSGKYPIPCEMPNGHFEWCRWQPGTGNTALECDPYLGEPYAVAVSEITWVA